MKKIIKIEIHPPNEIFCYFEGGINKKADISECLKAPVFEPLNNPINLLKAENRGYYLEWPEWEVDLSADTLWHLGTTFQKEKMKTEIVL